MTTTLETPLAAEITACVEEMSEISTKSVHRLLDRDLLKASTAFRHKLIPAWSVEEFVVNTTQRNGGAQ